MYYIVTYLTVSNRVKYITVQANSDAHAKDIAVEAKGIKYDDIVNVIEE